MACQNLQPYNHPARSFAVNQNNISISIESDPTATQLSDNIIDIVYDSRAAKRTQEALAPAPIEPQEYQVPWESDFDPYAMKVGDAFRGNVSELALVEKVKAAGSYLSSNNFQNQFPTTINTYYQEVAMFAPNQALDHNFNFIQEVNPNFSFGPSQELNDVRSNQYLNGEDGIDPLSSSLFYCYLSGSSVLTFDNMAPSGCPTVYSSHSSASFDNGSFLQLKDQTRYSEQNAKDSFVNTLNQLQLHVAAKPQLERAVFSLDYSPNEYDDYEKSGPTDFLAPSCYQSFIRAPRNDTLRDSEKDQEVYTEDEPHQDHNYGDSKNKKKEGSTKVRNHKCPVCLKVFKRPLSFRIHYSIHTGERDHRCNWPGCGKLFNVKSNMTRHQKVHFKRQGRRK